MKRRGMTGGAQLGGSALVEVDSGKVEEEFGPVPVVPENRARSLFPRRFQRFVNFSRRRCVDFHRRRSAQPRLSFALSSFPRLLPSRFFVELRQIQFPTSDRIPIQRL
jgi:hypothetical protein